jgi:hypothetical protein
MRDETKLRYWREKDEWCCAVPRDDIATRNGFHWKRYGLVGRGKTKKEALNDWFVWQRCSDLVADIY